MDEIERNNNQTENHDKKNNMSKTQDPRQLPRIQQ